MRGSRKGMASTLSAATCSKCFVSQAWCSPGLGGCRCGGLIVISKTKGRGADLWGQGCSSGPKLFGRLPSTSSSSIDGLELLEIGAGGVCPSRPWPALKRMDRPLPLPAPTPPVFQAFPAVRPIFCLLVHVGTASRPTPSPSNAESSPPPSPPTPSSLPPSPPSSVPPPSPPAPPSPPPPSPPPA